MRTFFALALPSAEGLKQQRFDLMWHGRLSWQDWNRMSPADRDDFVERLNVQLAADGENNSSMWTAISKALSSALGGSGRSAK